MTAGARRWWANCAWDALAIPLFLDVDADIDSECADRGEPLRISVRGGALVDDGVVREGVVQFPWPARHVPQTPAERQAQLTAAGLTSAFWALS